MFSPDTLNEALLKRFLVELGEGDQLFSQGDKGNTMYVILRGEVRLTHKVQNNERVVGVLKSGEIIGEKAICGEGAYRRNCSAVAGSELSMLEFGFEDLKVIQAKMPDFVIKVLSLVTKRLDRANMLVSILQIRDEVERLVNYLVFMSKHAATRHPKGAQLQLTPESIADSCALPNEFVASSLNVMIRRQLVLKEPEGFVIPDENALVSSLASLRDRVAA